MYEHEEIEENEGKNLAKELNAIFQKTSAKEATGVEDLFLKIAKKFLNPSDSEGGNQAKTDKSDKKKIKLEKSKREEKKKKGCC